MTDECTNCRRRMLKRVGTFDRTCENARSRGEAAPAAGHPRGDVRRLDDRADPLQLVLRYDDPGDQEIAGLLAAAFAYGRADIVVVNVGGVLDRMTPSPVRYLTTFVPAEGRQRFRGFTHRFHKTPNWWPFCRVSPRLRNHGSLANLFRLGYRDETPTWPIAHPLRRSPDRHRRTKALDYL